MINIFNKYIATEKIGRIIRFLFSGGSSAVFSLGLLYIFTSWLGIWYLFSSVLAMAVATVYNFILQKYWTFNDKSKNRTGSQIFMFIMVMALNFVLNALFMYILVDLVHLWYMASQFLVTGGLAIMNYFAYGKLIFSEQNNKNNADFEKSERPI